MYIRTVIGIQLYKNLATFRGVTCPFVFVPCCRSCPCHAVWMGGSSRLLCSSSSPSSRCVVVFRTTSSCLLSPSTAASTVAWCCVILGRLSVDTASARAALTSCLGWGTSNFQLLTTCIITISCGYHEENISWGWWPIASCDQFKRPMREMLLWVRGIKDAIIKQESTPSEAYISRNTSKHYFQNTDGNYKFDIWNNLSYKESKMVS